MHKKLAADLTSLAHSILQMKNKDDEIKNSFVSHLSELRSRLINSFIL